MLNSSRRSIWEWRLLTLKPLIPGHRSQIDTAAGDGRGWVLQSHFLANINCYVKTEGKASSVVST